MDAKQALREAADLLERTGWCQGTDAVDENGAKAPHLSNDEAAAYCAIGAIEHVIGMEHDLSDHVGWSRRVGTAKARLLMFVSDKETASLGGRLYVSVWNDAKDRTAGEVVETMRRAGRDA